MFTNGHKLIICFSANIWFHFQHFLAVFAIFESMKTTQGVCVWGGGGGGVGSDFVETLRVHAVLSSVIRL